MASSDPLVILGCGYTGTRVARRLLARGARVTATARDLTSLLPLADLGVQTMALDLTNAPATTVIPPGARVLISIPALRNRGQLSAAGPALRELLENRPKRVVYLSSTGVYGPIHEVDETTPIYPETLRQRLRAETESILFSGPWSTLILRPAAIYGPGRGAHRAIKEGRYTLVGKGSNYISRIYVDDLAALAEAALVSDLEGAYPVADDEPCTATEMVSFCIRLLGLPMPPPAPASGVSETLRASRRVDGRAIRSALSVSLQYPSFRTGIPAALRDEKLAGQQRSS